MPPVDIFETDGHDLVIKVELPDVTREDIEVTVEHNTLTLSGEKKLPADVKEEQFRRVERRYGTFTRSFTLPNTVDAGQGQRRIQERRADGEAAVPRGSEAADDQRRSRGVSPRDRDQGTGARLTAIPGARSSRFPVLGSVLMADTDDLLGSDGSDRAECPPSESSLPSKAVSCSWMWRPCAPSSCAAAPCRV